METKLNFLLLYLSIFFTLNVTQSCSVLNYEGTSIPAALVAWCVTQSQIHLYLPLQL